MFRVYTTDRDVELASALSPEWTDAVGEVTTALSDGASVAVVGEAGVGKAALLGHALRRVRPHDRILHARPPEPSGAEAWLALWTPELGKPHTSVIAGRVDALPAWAGGELAAIVAQRARGGLAVTAHDLDAVPPALARLVDVVVELPPLRHRRGDVLVLAHHVAAPREIAFTPAAARALHSYDWPGNADQLKRVVRAAANRATLVDTRHLDPEVLCSTGRALSRMETLERDEIARCLAEPGMSVTRAAGRLGISRATAYRRIAQYGIRVPS